MYGDFFAFIVSKESIAGWMVYGIIHKSLNYILSIIQPFHYKPSELCYNNYFLPTLSLQSSYNLNIRNFYPKALNYCESPGTPSWQMMVTFGGEPLRVKFVTSIRTN